MNDYINEAFNNMNNEVHWGNDYEDEPPSWWYPSRAAVDNAPFSHRVAVIRREIVDGVVSYYKEDV